MLMKKAILIIFLTIFNVNAQDVPRKVLKFKPKNINEAIILLNKIHNDSIKKEIRNMSENEFLFKTHLSLGMWVRNNWKLWRRGKLSTYFNELGIHHPMDMSGIILRCYHRDLKGNPIKFNETIKSYKKHIKDVEEHNERMKSDSIYAKKVNQEQLNAKISYWNNLRKNFTLNENVTTYLINSCGFFGSYNRSKIKGKIVDLGNKDKIQIEIIEYFDLKKKKGINKCNNIVNNKIWVNLEKINKL